MITATDCAVFVVRCDACKHEDWVILPAGASACDAEDNVRRNDGWRVGDEHVCLSCQHDEGLTPEQQAGFPMVSVPDVEPV